MAKNIAAKRARKEQQRRQAAAARRRAEAFEASLAGQVNRAAQSPIRQCLLSETLHGHGLGTLVLTRGNTPYNMTAGVFLLDTFCLGVKDVMFRRMDQEELDLYSEATTGISGLAPVEPSHARKLLRDLAAWAQSIGFPPHRDFSVIERLFGDVDANTCDASFVFGRHGKPFYVPGPADSPTLIRSRLEHLRRKLGEGGFDHETFL